MKIARYLTLAILLPLPAMACISPIEDPSNVAIWAARGGFVQFGYVTGTSYPDYEASIIRSGKSENPLHGRHVVRVAFTESIKGGLSGSMEVATSCWSKEPQLGTRAIVYSINGQWTVEPVTPEYEQRVKDEFAKLPKNKR